jgi:phage terminase large subunit-like protein
MLLEARRYRWTLNARPNQLPPNGNWRVWLIQAGRGFGKTRIGAEWTRESAKQYPLVNIIGATAAHADLHR